MATHTSSAAPHSSAASSPDVGFGIRGAIGTLLVRVIVPLWLLTGALFKLVSLDPRLLPKPIFELLKAMNGALGTEFGQFLMFSYRSMVAVELVLVGVMFFVPKLARKAAIAILSLFCLILIAEMIGMLNSSDFTRNGFSIFLKPCGCFGGASPPTIVTFLIDAGLLAGVILCRPNALGRFSPGWPTSGVLGVASLVVGFGLGFGRPAKPDIVVTPDTTTVADGTQSGAEPSTVSGDGAAAGASPATATTPSWPAMPATLKSTYFVSEKKALGQRLRDIDLGALISTPLPGDLDKGRWHLVFYRKDCEHCHDLLRTHFGGTLPAPTLTIAIPDTTGEELEMPCSACSHHTLPKGPDYVLPAPMLFTIQDGVIVGISLDVDKQGAVEAVLNAGKPGAKAVDGALVLENVGAPAATPAPPAAPSAPKAPVSTSPFPPAPASLESFYAPEFEKWAGTRFDSQPFALLVKRPLPLDPNRGTVVVVYYRADCEHCHTLLADHFSRSLPAPTLAIAIPDTDPANALDMPCDQCTLATLPEGPTYVVETPVLLVLEDGVVKGALVGSAVEDPTAVEKLLGVKSAP